MAEKVQNLYRTPPVQPQKPQPVIRWTARETLICALLVFFVVTAYFSVWRFEFVYFDDPGYVSENLDVLRGLPLFTNVERFKASVYWAFTAFEQSNWHPLTWLSHMLDVQLYGSKKPKDLEPGDFLGSGGHHITNIILHSMNTLFLFGLFWRMTGKSWRSAAVAAMFAIHPMHVESVAWVAERKDVLSTFFGLLTLHAYVSYGAHARFNGGSLLFAATLTCFVGILGWLWYSQCFWYLWQVILFQRHEARAMPIEYESLSLTGPIFAAFATLFILAVGAVGLFAASSGRTRLLKYCGILLGFTLVGTILLASLWSSKSFEGGEARQWTNWIGGGTAALLAIAGGIVAAIQQRSKIAMQCAVFAVSVAALVIVLNWIQLPPPKSPAASAWYNNPFQTVVERIWYCEFAVAIFVVFGSLAVDSVAGRRTNLWLFCVVFLLYMLGLLAKPMLVTLPFIMLLLDYWPLGRVDPLPASEGEKPAPAAPDPARLARRRARQRRRPSDASFAQTTPLRTSQEPSRTIIRLLALIVEKAPLFALAIVSSMVTPIAQSHGGSMASTSDLSIGFRIQNVMKSFGVYLGKMFWPGKMMSLHLLAQDDRGLPHVEPTFFLIGVAVVVVLSAVAVAAFFLGRRYITFGWLWYVGILVPVIGFVQVGEQRWADRYTYVPYVGLFVAIVWTIGELIDRFPRRRPTLLFATAGGAALVLTSWTSWTNYQIQSWRDVETHLVHALEVEPDNWNMLNNHGVFLWKEADTRETERSKLIAEGNTQEAQEKENEVLDFKDRAMKSWIHGIKSRPTATDIHSNLGYAYSEKAGRVTDAERNTKYYKVADYIARAKAVLKEAWTDDVGKFFQEKWLRLYKKEDISIPPPGSQQGAEPVWEIPPSGDMVYLWLAEYHLFRAVSLKDISPRPHNNLGRVFLREGQQFDIDALAANAKGTTDATEAAFAKRLKAEADNLNSQAIAQFERAVQLDPSLLEGRLNLGEVFSQLKQYDQAAKHYHEIVGFDSPSIIDPGAKANFSQAHFGLARIALAQNKVDEAMGELKQAIARNPNNMAAFDPLATQDFLHGNYREGEQVLRMWLSKLAPLARRQLAEQFGKRFEGGGKHEQAVRAWIAMAWIFATSPEPQLRDPQAALGIADGIVKLTKQQDPLALDTLAAAYAENGQFPRAVEAAQEAINLANSQGNKPLAELIAERLAYYQRQTPYVSKPDGSDRP